MASLTDPDVIAKDKHALAEWELEGAVELIGRAHDGLRTTLEGITEKQFKQLLCRFVCEENGTIDRVKEAREPWSQCWEWHCDLRLTINGVNLYVETRLWPEAFSSRQEPSIHVVQIKPA